MRITRAAKIAAIPLTALILVALIACQGPAGPAGKDGAKGDAGKDGVDGGQGPPGTSGTDAFQAKVGVTPILLNSSELKDKNGRKLDTVQGTPNLPETATMTIDLGGYFVGGSGERKYAVIGTWGAGSDTPATNTAANSAIKAEVKGSMLEYTLTLPATGWDGDPLSDTVDNTDVDRLYTDGFMATVRGTDSDIAADAKVVIMLNRKPTLTGNDTNSDGVVDESINDQGAPHLVLGIQDLKRRNSGNTEDLALAVRPGVHKACAKIHECVLDVFKDDGDITVTVVSMTRNDLTDTSKVGSSAKDNDVTLTGMMSTWDKDKTDSQGDSAPGDVPVTVKLKATDKGGQSLEASVLVAVNGPPTLSKGASDIGRSGKVKVGEKVSLTTDAAGLFTDLETDARTLTLKSSNALVATAEIPDSGATSGHLEVSGIAAGPATITLTATSTTAGMFQTAKMEFTVTVTAE